VLNVWDDGLYMYQQAAREIADARGWSDDRLTALLEDMAAAINNGKLTTHDRKTGMARPLNRPEFFGLVTPESVNKWLASTQAIYQWTPQAPVTEIKAAGGLPDAPVVDVPASEPRPAATGPRFIMKRVALIANLEYEWSSIKTDISDAIRNGLKAAAHTGKHGEWDADKARAWAVLKGKVKQTTPVNQLASVWNGATTRHTISH